MRLAAAYGLGLAVAAGAAAHAQTPVSGEQLYRQRCAACHDGGLAGAPGRDHIARKPQAYIVHTLTDGAMKPQAAGLNPEQVAAVARWLTTRPAAPVRR